eukprot:3418937-Pyramimonas_sp.AAC.1
MRICFPHLVVGGHSGDVPYVALHLEHVFRLVQFQARLVRPALQNLARLGVHLKGVEHAQSGFQKRAEWEIGTGQRNL